MKRLLTIIFFLIGLGQVSLACCIEDDRTLTERLFQGNGGTIFTCKVLTFSTPKYPDGIQMQSSDGSIDGTATAEIVEVYFGKVDTTIITLRAGSYLKIGKTYLIYTSGSGRVFGFGGNCDRWTKQVADIPDSAYEVRLVKQFADIIKNKQTGNFVFKSQSGVVMATGKYKKGVAIGLWQHFNDKGIIKVSFDIKKNITSHYFSNGFIKSKQSGHDNIKIYESFIATVNGQLQRKEIDTIKSKSLTINTFFEYSTNGILKKMHGQSNLNGSGGFVNAYEEYFDNGNLQVHGQYSNNKRVGLWKWYNQDGTFQVEYDYKIGTINQ